MTYPVTKPPSRVDDRRAAGVDGSGAQRAVPGVRLEGVGDRHVLDGLGLAVAAGDEDLVFSLVQLCASATGKPLTDDELRLIAEYPRELALLFPGQLG
jgi:hypothetical protein